MNKRSVNSFLAAVVVLIAVIIAGVIYIMLNNRNNTSSEVVANTSPEQVTNQESYEVLRVVCPEISSGSIVSLADTNAEKQHTLIGLVDSSGKVLSVFDTKLPLRFEEGMTCKESGSKSVFVTLGYGDAGMLSFESFLLKTPDLTLERKISFGSESDAISTVDYFITDSVKYIAIIENENETYRIGLFKRSPNDESCRLIDECDPTTLIKKYESVGMLDAEFQYIDQAKVRFIVKEPNPSDVIIDSKELSL